MTSSLVYRVIQTRAGGAVQRCHAIRHLSDYSNAKHSWGVAMLLWALWPELFGRLGIHALAHDVGEFVSGDIPSPILANVPEARAPIKRMEQLAQRDCGVPEDAALSEDDHLVLKACDLLDLYLWAREEVAAGNLFANALLQRLRVELRESPLRYPAHDLFEQFETEAVLPQPSIQVMERLIKKERST